MNCWFENRVTGKRLQMHGLVRRIGIRRAEDLAQGFKDIEAAQAQGYWVALILAYELGAWLEPALEEPLRTDSAHAGKDRPDEERLTALVFERAVETDIEVGTAGAAGAEQVTDTKVTDDQVNDAQVIKATAGIGRTEYVAMIEDIRALIAAGEVYQINATFPLTVHVQGSPRDLYLKLASASRAGHCAFIEDPDNHRSILSFSPELFLERHGNTLVTRPMKGTAPRIWGDPAADQAMGQSLLRSGKDRAENLMIVDLLRNDLGRLAVTGSVKVDPLFALESYPTVWTMTSTIRADLKPGCRLLDILQALFPCGSVTGAPKIAAMHHIRRLEARSRGVYCGSVGWLAPHGDMSLNVAIRTLVLGEDGVGTYSVGGGIVHDSVAQREWQECFWKARVLGIECETETD